ncbi:MAG: hypothetical protein DRR08_25945, partial [Candidatus Parabeggiatoa sp. nov. 2]
IFDVLPPIFWSQAKNINGTVPLPISPLNVMIIHNQRRLLLIGNTHDNIKINFGRVAVPRDTNALKFFLCAIKI